MNLDRTQPLPPQDTQQLRSLYRCPCGTDVEFTPQQGGQCPQCQRIVPASATQMSTTMTFLEGQPVSAVPGAGDDARETDQLIGKTLGHFEIVALIGRGGMGQVYRALDTSLQRYVAVKVIHGADRTAIDSEGQARLMYEAVAQARVNHPNIVTIYFVGKECGTPFLAMELIDGYDASELIQQGAVPYESLCSMALKITQALDVASQTGIVHADIKPQNLLILSDGNVKLSDFGMARIAEENQHQAAGGTPNYLAPELLQGSQPNMHSDMYALGVTLFELTFGRLPIALSGSTLPQWLAIHQAAKIEFPDPWPEHLPEAWKKILQRLLDKEPQNRYSSYRELANELGTVMPVKRPPARLFARSIAWLIDFVTIGLSVVFPVLALALMGVDIPDELQNTILLPSLCLYLLMTYWWRQSLGRELVHVKIVNRYSLAPSRRVMVTREFMRMQLLLMIILGSFLGLLVPMIELIFAGLGFAWTAADFLYAATVGRGQSLHDRFTKTRAVVGSDSS